MDFGLQDRVAVVTGAASGIGQACARALAAEGCRVLVTDIQEDGLRELEAEDADKYVPFVADLSTGFGPKSIIDAAISEFDRLDVLVTAGGVFGTAKGGLFGSDGGASVISVEEWDRTLNINLRGTFLVAQEAIPKMAENGWGRIVTIGSVSGQMGGFEAGADYIASKAGVAGVTRALALDAGPKGITVNTINPGMIETPMLAENVEGGSSKSVAERSAVRRLGTREELAAMVVMLCSQQAAFVTGSHVDVNGGFYFG